MPSSYTPLLRLVLPVTGELTGTWGDTVNNGITSLLEAAVAGTAAVTMTDANYTLTTANEATDEARNAVIVLSGTLTASRNVICPTSSKIYIVRNATTGAQSIVFKTAAGAGITVANGETRFLRCDGTNVVEAISALTATLTGNVTGNATNVTGIVALANGGTGAATQGPALANLGSLGADTQTKAANYTVVAGDRGDVIYGTGTWTLALTAAATLADGFNFAIVNAGTGTITIDPSGSETVDGLSTKDIAAGQSAILTTDGLEWRTVGYSQTAAATQTTAGIVELATDAEAQTGTDATRAVTPDNLGATVLGMGQTWQAVGGSRALATTYTNTTGRTIMVAVALGVAAAGQTVSATVNGTVIVSSPSQGFNLPVVFVVPSGQTYSVNATSGFSSWAELR